MEALSQQLLLWIILLPLVGAVVNGLLGRHLSRAWVTRIALGSVLGAFLLTCVAFISLLQARFGGADNPVLTYHVYEWFRLKLPTGAVLPVNVRFVMDALSGAMTLVVTGIGGLIHLYSVGYMSEEPSYSRFFAYLNLFMASMLILVLGSNLPLMFVGWEGVGLCSYLLIGFWFENRSYASAGRKAFVANRIGDFGVLIGMFILAVVTQSFEFREINALAIHMGAPFPYSPFGITLSVATVACLFLFLGCTGKSAQIPLFVWLPDAMAGPTPVSALIHAATMVTAGVYLCCRMSPVFAQSATVLALIAVVGTLTALLAASIALVQREMKKILAYSTVSQLGFMFAAVGVGYFAAGFFHVFTHAFFKACLFLGAGAVMHAVHAHGDADIFKLGGLKKHLPVTHWTFLISCAAIAGIPFFAGFFSKDEILVGAAAQALHPSSSVSQFVGWFTLVGLTLAAVMTAFYMFRLYYLTFTGEYRSAEQSADAHAYAAQPHPAPRSMAIPLRVLAIGAAVVGFLGLPHLLPLTGGHVPEALVNRWEHWLAPSLAKAGAHAELDAVNLAFLCGFGAMLIGVLTARALYRNKAPRSVESPSALRRLLFDKWRVDELYQLTIIDPIKKIAVAIGYVDQTFVDALLTKLPAFKASFFGAWLARLQNGVVHVYAVVMVAGLLVASWWFAYPRADFEVVQRGRRAECFAAAGYGYQYRWDHDGDGSFDTKWRKNRKYMTILSQNEHKKGVFITLEVKNAFGVKARKTIELERAPGRIARLQLAEAEEGVR